MEGKPKIALVKRTHTGTWMATITKAPRGSKERERRRKVVARTNGLPTGARTSSRKTCARWLLASVSRPWKRLSSATWSRIPTTRSRSPMPCGRSSSHDCSPKRKKLGGRSCESTRPIQVRPAQPVNEQAESGHSPTAPALWGVVTYAIQVS